MKCPPFMWHIKGVQPGPTVVVLGGTHGNELTGIAAVQILAELLGVLKEPFGKTYGRKHAASKLVCGNLYLGYGNPEAILRCTRSASSGPDLNRSFGPSELSAKPSRGDRADLKRARELAEVLAKADYLLDIHSVSTESVPFLCSATEGPRHRAAASLLPTSWFLSDPDLILAQDLNCPEHVTTDSWVNRNCGVGICYETGRDDRPQDVLHVLPPILMTLTHKFNVLKPHEYRVVTRFSPEALVVDTAQVLQDQPKQFYRLSYCGMAQEKQFTYDSACTEGWTPVVAGQLIGTYDSGAEVRAPHNGMLVLQRSPGRIVVGEHLFFIAVPA